MACKSISMKRWPNSSFTPVWKRILGCWFHLFQLLLAYMVLRHERLLMTLYFWLSVVIKLKHSGCSIVSWSWRWIHSFGMVFPTMDALSKVARCASIPNYLFLVSFVAIGRTTKSNGDLLPSWTHESTAIPWKPEGPNFILPLSFYFHKNGSLGSFHDPAIQKGAWGS